MELSTSLIEQLIAVVHRAGAMILQVYEQPDLHIRTKADASPVTIADRTANDLLVAALHQLTPEIPIVAEESPHTSYAARRQHRYCWLVDPLDGTKEFIQRNGEFSVNVALIDNGRAVLGIVLAPVSAITYWAVRGSGAYQRVGGEDQRLDVATFRWTDAGLRVLASRSHLNAPTREYIDQLRSPCLVRLGSSLKLMEIAAGRAHLYPRLGPTSEWDIAAAQVIVEEAGGSVTDLSTHEPLYYNKLDLSNPWFVAMGRLIT